MQLVAQFVKNRLDHMGNRVDGNTRAVANLFPQSIDFAVFAVSWNELLIDPRLAQLGEDLDEERGAGAPSHQRT